MKFEPNDLFHEMVDLYQDNRLDENGETQQVIIDNEGGTRSSKTWDFFHFLVLFCDHNRNKENDIYCLRDTLVNCRDFTFKEFQSCLKSIKIWDQSRCTMYPKPYYDLFGNNVFFRGLEDEADSEAYPSDILFFNEALEIKKTQFDGLKMRNRKLIVMDWNPKFTKHWCFDLEGQPNVFFTHSTYKNNKHLQRSIVREMESYEPYESGTYEVIERQLMYKGTLVSEKNEPPPNVKNVENKTADAFRWKVYGLGLRGAMKGVIFDSVVYDAEFPEMGFIYGNDFGFTADPNALVKYGETATDIYIELLAYHPIETPSELNQYYESIDMSKDSLIIADSSDKHVSGEKGSIEMVRAMRQFDWNMRKVSKTKGVMFWILSMKQKQIHIVKSALYEKARIEQENYRMKEIHGIEINQPEDKHNHFWDAARYCHMSWQTPSGNF